MFAYAICLWHIAPNAFLGIPPMSTDSFAWLHLTDFHYGLKEQDCLWPNLREPFFESLGPLHDRCGPWHAVFFTGDLVQSGESTQFAKMQTEVLDPLWKKLTELGSGDAVFLAVPGNHDLYRPNSGSPDFDDPAMETLLRQGGFKSVETKFWDQPGGTYRRAIKDVFAAYNEWWKQTPRKPNNVVDGAVPSDFSSIIEVGKRRVGIVGLNTAFLQLSAGDYKGKLVWDARQLHAVCDGGIDKWERQNDVNFLLTHHGADWLTTQSREHGESEISPPGRFAAHLFGHQHETGIEYTRYGGSRDSTRLLQGRSVFGMDKFGNPPTTHRAHGYSTGRIEFGDTQSSLRLWPRTATNKTKRWRFIPDHEGAELEVDEGTSPEFIKLKQRTPTIKSTAVQPIFVEQPAVTLKPPPLAPFIPHSTLPARRPFFGRKPDLERIAKYLSPEDRSWGVVLDGPGGVGKTSLALEAAYRAPIEHFPLKLWITAKRRELHPDGERSLTDHRVDDYYGLLSELGTALGRDDISRAAPEDRPQIVRHALAYHKALLVLDNLESFHPEDRRRLFELLGSLPTACRAIVTSRRRTDGSSAAHTIRVDKLERDAADKLLAELGYRWPPVARLTLNERNQLYAETGGNPLLLTWTAGQLGRITGRCRTVLEAIERLQEAHRLQKVNANNDPLNFIFGDLAESFTAEEVTVLAALVHFTQPARVEWLLPLTMQSVKVAEMALDGLRDRALLVEDDLAGTWFLPPLAARFLRRARPEAVLTSGDRLANWAYASAIANGYAKYKGFPDLEAAWPQLAAALPVVLVGDSGRLMTMCSALNLFLHTSGRWDENLLLNAAGESRAVQEKDFGNAIQRTHVLAFCYYLRDQTEEILACAKRADRYFKGQRLDDSIQSYVLRIHGLANLSAGRTSDALLVFRKALKLERTISSISNDVVTALSDVALALAAADELDEADIFLQQGLEMAKTLNNWEAVCALTSSLAGTALDRNSWSEAELLARESLEVADRIGHKHLAAAACMKLADSLIGLDRGAEGRPYAERAVSLFAELRSSELASARMTLNACQT